MRRRSHGNSKGPAVDIDGDFAQLAGDGLGLARLLKQRVGQVPQPFRMPSDQPYRWFPQDRQTQGPISCQDTRWDYQWWEHTEEITLPGTDQNTVTAPATAAEEAALVDGVDAQP
jgi:hypothetical protein